MTYDFFLTEEQYREKIRRYNLALNDAYVDYEKNENHGYYEPNLNSFRYWMERRWGIKIEIINGKIGSSFSVTDEAKYVMFTLRYTK